MEHNKLFTMTNIDYLPISFFKKIIMDNEIFKKMVTFLNLGQSAAAVTTIFSEKNEFF